MHGETMKFGDMFRLIQPSSWDLILFTKSILTLKIMFYMIFNVNTIL